MKIINLQEHISVLESGSRPIGGVFLTKGTIPSIGAEHLSENATIKLHKLKFIESAFFISYNFGS